MSSTAQNHPRNIFVATRKNTGEIVQIVVHHQSQNGRDCWTASSPGERGITQSNLSAAGAASQLSNLLQCEGLTVINLNPGAATTPVIKKEPTPEEEFDELLTKYAEAITATRVDPSAIMYARHKVAGFVKNLVRENHLLRSRINQLETEMQARDDQWSQWR